MRRIRVFIADDHTVLRDSLRAFLSLYEDIEVVGEGSDGLTTLREANQLSPDVVLLDLAMPNLGGLEVLRRLAKEQPECKVIVLTQHDAPQYVLPSLQAGARGYLLKKSGGAEVVQAVRAVVRGERVLDPAIARHVIEAAFRGASPSESPAQFLTDREREVLALIGEGKTNLEIADTLCISPKTVDKHRASLIRKLNVGTRAGLIRYALEKK